MTYSSGSLIQAADYNGYAGGNVGANVSGELNTVLGTGKGNAGYGQVGVTNVTAVTDTVTATQWTTLLNGINKVRKHQSGAGFTNIGTVATGETITANVNISGNLTTAYSNRLIASATGTTTTGSTNSPAFSAPNNTSAQTFAFTRTATFASADQARYFFNAGGKLNFVITSVTNTGATQRGSDLANLAATYFASIAFLAGNNGGRTGTGGTLTSSNTSLGYYDCTTANASAVKISTTSATYTGDYVEVFAKTNGVQGSYSDNGTVMNISMVLYAAAQSPAFNDSIDITVNHRVDVVYPETTFLANTWGSVTIS